MVKILVERLEAGLKLHVGRSPTRNDPRIGSCSPGNLPQVQGADALPKWRDYIMSILFLKNNFDFRFTTSLIFLESMSDHSDQFPSPLPLQADQALFRSTVSHQVARIEEGHFVSIAGAD